MAENSVIDWMALTFIPGLGNKTIQQLVERFGSPKALFAACAEGGESCAVIKKNLCSSLARPAPFREKAKALLQRLHTGSAVALCPDDECFPTLLTEISDPPAVIYAQGKVELLQSPCIAMVGSRAATGYGRRSAYTLARQMAESGVTVVSGLALGVDGEAHKGALSVQGNTIGVLGCGLDVVYPRNNAQLFEQIRTNGLLLTEYPLGTRPDGFRFPARNRIISGLCSGVVVVEAAKKSGSLITAQMALDEGREVFAVPGQIDSFKSSGTHSLLQQGAKLVQSVDDIFVECGGLQLLASSEQQDKAVSQLDPEGEKLLSLIDVYPSPRNEIIAKSGLSVARVTELLLLFELDELIEIVPGDEVRRVQK